MTALLSLCEDAVALARRRGIPAAEAFALHARSTSITIEKGTVSAAESEETQGFAVRVVVEGRIGFAYATRKDEAPKALDEAVRSSRIGKRIGGFSFAPGRGPTRAVGTYDARVARLAEPDLLAAADEVLAGAGSVRGDVLIVGGGVEAAVAEFAVANTEGLSRAHRDTGLSASAYAVQRRHGVSTGFSTRQSTTVDVDWSDAGREAAELCVSSAKPKPLDRGGAYPCIIRPDAAADLLGTITIPALYGRPAHRGESHYSGKQGKKVAHATLSLWDDPTLRGAVGSTPLDDEGTPTRRRALIRRGVLATFLYDRRDAAEFGAASTASAFRLDAFDGRSHKSPPSSAAHQVIVEAPARRTEKLVSQVDEGLLVHDLMGVHTANTTSGDFSVTSSILFRIRKGAVEGPLAPVSLAGNLPETLRRSLQMGDDAKTVGGAPALRLPSILFEGFAATP